MFEQPLSVVSCQHLQEYVRGTAPETPASVRHSAVLTVQMDGEERVGLGVGKSAPEALHGAFALALEKELGPVVYTRALDNAEIGDMVNQFCHHFNVLLLSEKRAAHEVSQPVAIPSRPDHSARGAPTGGKHRYDGPRNDEHRPV